MYHEHYATESNHRVREEHGLFYVEYFDVRDSIWESLYEMGTSDKRFADHIMGDLLERSREDYQEYMEEMERLREEARESDGIY